MGIIHNDVVDASMRRIQFITIVLILILNGCIALLLIGTVFVLMDSRLRMKEHEQMILLKRKELTEQMFSGLGRIVDRFAVGDLKNNRYEYHENLLKHPIYPETGYYDDLVKNISHQYLVMTDTENKKMNHLLTPDYLRCVLKKRMISLKLNTTTVPLIHTWSCMLSPLNGVLNMNWRRLCLSPRILDRSMP